VIEAVPLVLILVGLTAYVVLGGADFGAGLWQLLAGRGPGAERIREHAHRSMAPVWEANHVWLIFVLTVLWTSYPEVFGSVASTLSLPLAAAGLGIVARGAAYALRAGARDVREASRIDLIFAASSVLTPFALGCAVGAVAAGRVPVGNAAGDLLTSWTGALSLVLGALAVATSAHLAAVFLAADAARRGERALVDAFRARALAAGIAAGALAGAALAAVRADAPRLFDALTSSPAVACVAGSAAAGLATLALVAARRFEPARYLAAAAVGAVVAGWAVGQWPVVLPGLTVEQAAAPRDTLVAVIVAIAAGAIVVLPALGALLRLTLAGRLVADAPDPAIAAGAGVEAGSPRAPALAPRGAVAGLVAGFGLLTVADAGWAHAVGVVSLFAFVACGAASIVPGLVAGRAP
jgi:cytochrome d ubiquinol oxidase subunit II